MRKYLSLLFIVMVCVMNFSACTKSGGTLDTYANNESEWERVPDNPEPTDTSVPTKKAEKYIFEETPEPTKQIKPTAIPEPPETPKPMGVPVSTKRPKTEKKDRKAKEEAPKKAVPVVRMLYTVEVDVTNQVVNVYGPDEKGEYTRLVKQMICSTGAPATPTIMGTFVIPKGGRRFTKAAWGWLQGNVWGRYLTRIKEGYLFHSVLYGMKSEDSLIESSFNDLGTAASHGCVRLLVADAKWIYNNILPGTTVNIVAKPADQHLTASLKPAGLAANDENAESEMPISISLNVSDGKELIVGETVALQATVQMSNNATKDETSMIEWKSSDKDIIALNKNVIKAISSGTATLEAQYRNAITSITLNVKENEPEPTGVPVESEKPAEVEPEKPEEVEMPEESSKPNDEDKPEKSKKPEESPSPTQGPEDEQKERKPFPRPDTGDN